MNAFITQQIVRAFKHKLFVISLGTVALCAWLFLYTSGSHHQTISSRVSAQTESSLFLPLVIDNTQSVQLTEFMASNQNTLVDEDGNTPDWIELYNPTSAPINMLGWSLTDDKDNLRRWGFPDVVIPSGQYLVVMASGKNRSVAGSELHTNFKLDQDGEFLALVKPDGRSIVTSYDTYPQQYADRSFGLSADDLGAQLLTNPTPGSANEGALLIYTRDIDVRHEPAVLQPGESLKIIATVSQPEDSVATTAPVDVTLRYRVMFDEVIDQPMWDDGRHGDGAAGDGVYAATLSGNLLTDMIDPGEMIRYAITVQTADGSEYRHPHFLTPTDSAEYFGTIVEDAQINSELPVLHWFIEDLGGVVTRTGTRASLYFNGTFYDNVLTRLRGGISVSYPKRGVKFEFNHLEPLTITDTAFGAAGVDAPTLKMDEINLSTTYSDKSYIRQPLAFDTYRDAGTPSPISFPIRIQQNGDFHMVSIFVEQPDERFLKRNNLDPDGALYKMFNPVVPSVLDKPNKIEKKTRKHEGYDDLLALATGIAELEGDALAQFLIENIDLPQVINYLAVSNIIQQNDHIAHNYYLYRDSDGTGLWSVLPWDEDFTFGRSLISDKDDVNNDGNTGLLFLQDEIWATHEFSSHPLFGTYERPLYGNWNYLYDAIMQTPQTRELYLRRLRTLMDQLLQPPGTPVEERYFEPRIDALTNRMAADVALDAELWPVDWGQPQTFMQAVDVLKRDYLDARRAHMYGTHIAEQDGIIPVAQPARSPVAFEQFRFNSAGVVEANSVNGTSIDTSQDLAREQEFFTLQNSAPYAVDLSGWRVTQNNHFFAEDNSEQDNQTNGVSIEFAPGTVLPAGGTLCIPADTATFHQSVVGQMDQSGRTLSDCLIADNYRGALSSRVGSIELRNSQNQLVDLAQYIEKSDYASSLVVSELSYKDAPEFVEIINTSTAPIDVSRFRFSAGIDFTFTDNVEIEPGAAIVIVKDIDAFTQHYADSPYATATVAGVYAGSLNDDGETLTLLDQSGHTVALLTYNDGLLPTVDLLADGHTLNRRQPLSDYNVACGWVASTEPFGTPGVHPHAEDFSCRPAAYLPFAGIE